MYHKAKDEAKMQADSCQSHPSVRIQSSCVEIDCAHLLQVALKMFIHLWIRRAQDLGHVHCNTPANLPSLATAAVQCMQGGGSLHQNQCSIRDHVKPML